MKYAGIQITGMMISNDKFLIACLLKSNYQSNSHACGRTHFLSVPDTLCLALRTDAAVLSHVASLIPS